MHHTLEDSLSFDLSQTILANKRPIENESQVHNFLCLAKKKKISKFAKDKVVLDFAIAGRFNTIPALAEHSKIVYGVDYCYDNSHKLHKTYKNIFLFKNFSELQETQKNLLPIDCVTAFGSFSLLYPIELWQVLEELYHLTSNSARIYATGPTPKAKKLIRRLTYNLKIAKPSPLLDYKEFFTKPLLSYHLSQTGWQLEKFKKTRFGLTSFYILSKKNVIE